MDVLIPDRRLGKAAPKFDPRTLRMAMYVDPAAFDKLPASIDWGKAWEALGKPWEMFGNDKYGDCTCAALGHSEQVWRSNAHTDEDAPVTEADVVAFATLVGALEGANMLDVLNRYLTDGLAGEKPVAFVAVDPTRRELIKYAIATFGTAYIGVNLPVTAQSQADWTYVPSTNGNEPGSWGGHAINAMAYDADFISVVTWGQRKRLSWEFFDRYCDEAFAILSDDWVSASGQSPSGFDLAAMQKDLGYIKR